MRPYSTEYIQAEVDFAATDLATPYYLAGCLVAESETLATEPMPQAISRTYTENRKNGRKLTELQTMTHDTYVKVLSELKATAVGRQALHCAAEARQRFATFKPEVEELRHYIEQGTAHELGSGNESVAYMFAKDRQRYVATAAHDFAPTFMGDFFDIPSFYGGPKAYAAFKTADRACTLASGQGIDGAQQLTAYSPQDGMCIMEYVPGRPIHVLAPEEIATITSADLERYVHIVGRLAGRGLIVDYGVDTRNPGNILWHPERGFTVIDYRRNQVALEDIDGAVKVAAKALLCKPESFGSDDGPELCAEKVEAALPVLRELDAIARERLQSGVDYIRIWDEGDDDAVREFLCT